MMACKGNDCPVLQLSASRAQFISVEFKALTMKREHFSASSQLIENVTVIRIVRFKDERGRVSQVSLSDRYKRTSCAGSD